MIRKMVIDDYEQVYALWQSCSGVSLSRIDDSKEGIARFLDRNAETCLVEEENNEIVATILASYDGRRAYIYHTAVRDDARRKGKGKQLVEAELKIFKKLGVSKAAGMVIIENKNAQSFWKNCGFTIRKDLYYICKELDIMKV